MKKQDAERMSSMIKNGFGATSIARTLGISVNTVRSYIRRHPGLGSADTCRECGKKLIQSPGYKKKKFSSDQCRMAWWNSHREQVNRQSFTILICRTCGKEFESYANPKRKYCSRECYYKAQKRHSRRETHAVSADEISATYSLEGRGA